MKIWAYGDSNTYGYDPRSYIGGRYDFPWPEQVAEAAGCPVVNGGMNGRKIPCSRPELDWFRAEAGRIRPGILLLMLGTNDLLCGASAQEAARRMAGLLTLCGSMKTFLICPPPLQRGAWVDRESLIAESKELPGLYRRLAEQTGVRFADAGAWNISLAYDGVHFSEDGHRQFAGEIAAVLQPVIRDLSRDARSPEA